MAEVKGGRVAIDDIVEAASIGVMRAFEARKVGVPEFARDNGFFVKFDITAGGFPGPIEKFTGGINQPGIGG
jgi:hypothetical protein